MNNPGKCPACGAEKFLIIARRQVVLTPAAWPGPVPAAEEAEQLFPEPVTAIDAATVFCGGCSAEYRLAREQLVPVGSLEGSAVGAVCYTLDGSFNVSFDINLWLAVASERELVELALEGWSHAESADGVALFMASYGRPLADLFAACRSDGVLDTGLLETEINKDEALAWLREHRSDIYRKLVREFSFKASFRREAYLDCDDCLLDLSEEGQVMLDVAEFASHELTRYLDGRFGIGQLPGIAYLFPSFRESADSLEVSVTLINDDYGEADTASVHAEMERLLSGRLLMLPEGVVAGAPVPAAGGKVVPFRRR